MESCLQDWKGEWHCKKTGEQWRNGETGEEGTVTDQVRGDGGSRELTIPQMKESGWIWEKFRRSNQWACEYGLGIWSNEDPEMTPTLLPFGCWDHVLRWGKLVERFRREKSVFDLEMSGLRRRWVIKAETSKGCWFYESRAQKKSWAKEINWCSQKMVSKATRMGQVSQGGWINCHMGVKPRKCLQTGLCALGPRAGFWELQFPGSQRGWGGRRFRAEAAKSTVGGLSQWVLHRHVLDATS